MLVWHKHMAYINRNTEIISDFSTIVELVYLYLMRCSHMRHQSQDIQSGNPMICGCELWHELSAENLQTQLKLSSNRFQRCHLVRTVMCELPFTILISIFENRRIVLAIRFYITSNKFYMSPSLFNKTCCQVSSKIKFLHFFFFFFFFFFFIK